MVCSWCNRVSLTAVYGFDQLMYHFIITGCVYKDDCVESGFNVLLTRYVPPLKPVTSKWSLDLPESPSALEEELCKQESLLNQLHEDVMKRKDTDKEEQLWEVQRVVTQLKRKVQLVSCY